jgi:ABC-type transport system substrate-binding protein
MQRINRRKLLAATGSAAAAAALLAACSDDDDEPDAPGGPATGGTGSTGGAATGATGATGSAQGEPVADRLVIGVEYSGEETLDFMIGGGGAQSWLHRPHLETLLAKDRVTNKPTARLAEEWKVSDDGTEIYFKLRQGVKFHDAWGDLTAEDVAWNYDVHKRLEESSSVNRAVKEVQVISPTEVNVVLSRPDATILDLIFTDQYSTSGIVSKKHFEAAGNPTDLNSDMLASTGPWKLVEWAAGSHILFQAQEDHWRQTPGFKELEYRIINETSTRLSALLAGEISATTLPWDLHTTAEERGMKILTGPVPAFHVWMEFFGAGARDPATGEFRHPDSPLLDLRVRKALNKAIDRDALNESFLGGNAEVMLLNHMHSTREGWDPAWEQRWEEEYGYDPDAARALLESAGYGPSNPLKTTMLLSYQTGFPEGPDVQETIIAYWKDVGVEATLETVDRATERDVAEAFGYDNHFWMGTTLSATGLDGYRIRQINDPATLEADPTFKGNFRGINLPELEEVILQTIQAPNEAEFERLSKQMGEMAFVNHVTVPLFWLPTKILVDPKVIADWGFSGGLVGLWSHTEYAEPVRA